MSHPLLLLQVAEFLRKCDAFRLEYQDLCVVKGVTRASHRRTIVGRYIPDEFVHDGVNEITIEAAATRYLSLSPVWIGGVAELLPTILVDRAVPRTGPVATPYRPRRPAPPAPPPRAPQGPSSASPPSCATTRSSRSAR